MKQLIITKEYLLLIDEEAKIKYNNYYWHKLQANSIFKADMREPFKNASESTKKDCSLIIAYRPLTKEAKELDLPELPPFDEESESFTMTHEELRQIFDAGNAGSGGSMYNRVRKYNGYDDFRNKNSKFFKELKPKQFSLKDVENAFYMGWIMRKEGSTFPIEKQNYIRSLFTEKLPKEFMLGGGNNIKEKIKNGHYVY